METMWGLLSVDAQVREAVAKLIDENKNTFKDEREMLSFKVQILDTIYLIFDKNHRAMMQEAWRQEE